MLKDVQQRAKQVIWLNPENRTAALANTATEMAGILLRPLVGRVVARNAERRYAAWGYTAAALRGVRVVLAKRGGALPLWRAARFAQSGLSERSRSPEPAHLS